MNTDVSHILAFYVPKLFCSKLFNKFQWEPIQVKEENLKLPMNILKNSHKQDFPAKCFFGKKKISL